MRCTVCTFINPASMRFCGGCGRPLAAPPAERASNDHAAVDRSPAERRHLTVMFCDIIDSTAFSEQLDPEEWREIVRAYQAACAAAIQRFDGYIAQYLGDGILAYFGYPVAHEDDAQRAVRAALATVESMPALNRRFAAGEIAVRIAVHTGGVVVGEIGGGGRHEQLALGDVPNIAARLQSFAAPNGVVISGATHRLVEGYFEVESLGDRELKGISRPVEVYAIRAPTDVAGRLDRPSPSGLSPLVGRQDEIELICERWEEAKAGRGRIVDLVGEPGIGKTRLVRALRERIAGDAVLYVELRGSPYFHSSALHPVIETLQRALGIEPPDAPDLRLEKLEQARLTEGDPEMLPLLAQLLSLPHPAGYPLPSLNPEQIRQRTLEGIVEYWLAHARRGPVLIIVEDLHWIDPSTLALAGMLIGRIETERILLVTTHRPEFLPPWRDSAPVTHLALNRLTRRQVSSLVTGMSGGRTLPDEIQDQIAARADGIPLFVEELTRLVLESGLLRAEDGRYELAGALPPLGIPSTLRDSLMARLDRLGAAKDVAQRAAVLGREFSYRMIRAVASLDDQPLQAALARLVSAQLLQARGQPPETVYRFNHVLIQEEAYQSLLRSTRRVYHSTAADVLATQFSDVAENQPEIVAHHYTEAGAADRAVLFWQKAARRAVARSACEEAIRHYSRAIGIIETFPADARRAGLELRAQMGLANVLFVARGYASPETGAACERALAVSRDVEETPQLFEALMMLWSFYTVRADYVTARGLAERCMQVAEPSGIPTLVMWASLAVGQTLMFTGELTAARPYLERAFALYNPEEHRPHRFSSTQDPGVMAIANHAVLLAVLGYPDRAVAAAERARALAIETAHPHTTVYALACIGAVLDYLRDADAAAQAAADLSAVAQEHGFAFFGGVGLEERGRALVLAGRLEEGCSLIADGIATAKATEGYLLDGYFTLRLAEALGRTGRCDDAWTRWTEARESIERTGEGFYRPLLFQIEGDLRLACGPPDPGQAERCYQQAIDTARRQEAKLYELTATLRLARLWQEQGRIDAARDLLAGIYDRFTEGFETPDFVEARELLAALRERSAAHAP